MLLVFVVVRVLLLPSFTYFASFIWPFVLKFLSRSVILFLFYVFFSVHCLESFQANMLNYFVLTCFVGMFW